MGFFRENILKIVTFIIILIIAIVAFVLIFGGAASKKISPTSYQNMEKMMVNAAQKYVNDNKKLLPITEKEISKINLDTLVNEKYITELTSLKDNNVVCTGYVKISYKNNNYSYVPYLKCGSEYETSTIASYIKNNIEIVTSGTGLYKINDVYTYRGEDPNNYLLLGERLYRIIDIEDEEVRLISNKRIEYSMLWDDRYNIQKNSSVGINDFSKSRLKESLDAIYNSTDKDNVILSASEKEKIISHDLCIGKRSTQYDAISSNNECQSVSQSEYIGLITVSDYARASIDPNCNSIYSKSCVNYNYFYNLSTILETMTGVTDNTYQVFAISDGVATVRNASNTFRPNIVVYIGESSIYLTGDGTIENPYRVR